jgi:hypothetical protein
VRRKVDVLGNVVLRVSESFVKIEDVPLIPVLVKVVSQ